MTPLREKLNLVGNTITLGLSYDTKIFAYGENAEETRGQLEFAWSVRQE